MDEAAVIRRLLRATKRNDLELYISALRELCPMFFSYDHQNYARFLTLYYLQMLNLEVNYPGAQTCFVKNGFSIAGSSYPSTRKPVDQTIEQT